MSDFEHVHRRAWLAQAGLALLPGWAIAQVNPGRSAAATSPLPRIPANAIPTPRRLRYQVRGFISHLPVFATGELNWQHRQGQYEARLKLDAGPLGSRTQGSTGRIVPTGLQPLRFIDRSRHERMTEFDWVRAEARFGGDVTPLAQGTQDLASFYVQLACLFAANAASPVRYARDTQLSLPVAGPGKTVEAWRFVLKGEETLSLPGGRIVARKLVRLQARPDEPGAELWLAPTLGWLPARIRLREGKGNDVDLRWDRND